MHPEERMYVQRAVDKRVREFAAGRSCARRALAELAIRDFTLLPAPDRQPVWPPSTVGSISHTVGYCVAVAAPKELIAALGVDSERTGQVSRELWTTIACAAEYEWCMSLPPGERADAMTLLFSAKEAFYKCQYPLTREWLDFHDLRIERLAPSGAGAAFAVHFNRPVAIAGRWNGSPPHGRYLIRDGILTSGIALPAGAPDQ